MIKKIIKCSTVWCGPCRAYAPVFRTVGEMDKYKDIEFKSVDVENDDDGERLCEKYQIRTVPTTLLLDENDELIVKVGGALSAAKLTELIDERM